MSSHKTPFPVADSLKVAIRNVALEDDADRIFFMWPALYTVSLNYCRFVSPFVETEEGESLLQISMRNAVEGFKQFEDDNTQQSIRAFIEALVTHAADLCKVRLSVQTDDGAWLIWQYNEPLFDWMNVHGRKAVQIRTREEPFEKGPVLLKLLSYICSVRDIQVAHLDLRHLI